jgi:NitT/TauT family transport system substrate-binding protein
MPSILDSIAADFSNAVVTRDNITFTRITNEDLATRNRVLRKKVSIYFNSGSASLDMNAKLLLLQEARSLLDTFANAYIRVSGNTDSTGERDVNVSMSRKRAEAVVGYLVERLKIPRARFVVIGNGPDKPVSSNDSEEGRQMNRRTDFEVFSR